MLGPPAAVESGGVNLPAPTIRSELLTPTALPLATAVVTLLVSVVAPRHYVDGQGDDGLFVDVYFGDDEQKPRRQRPTRVYPYCWTAEVTHKYEQEGVFRPKVAAWFRLHNTSWVAAHRDLVAVYRNLSSGHDTWIRSLLAIPPELVPTRTNVRYGLQEGRSLAVGYTISYAVSRVTVVGCREDDRSPSCNGESARFSTLLLYNSTGGPGHEMTYTFQEPGTYRLQATLRNPLSAVTWTKTTRALDAIRGLQVYLNGIYPKPPYSLVTGSNVTLSATYAAGSDVRCSWRILPACESCLVLVAGLSQDITRTCEAKFMFPLSGRYSVTVDAWNPLGRKHLANLTPPVVVQDRVKGLRAWTIRPRYSIPVGWRVVLRAVLEEGTGATITYKAASRPWMLMHPLQTSNGAHGASLRFGKVGLHKVKVRAANLVSSDRVVVSVRVWRRLTRNLVLGVINCRGPRATAAVFGRDGLFHQGESFVYSWNQTGGTERHTAVPFLNVLLPYGLEWDSFYITVRIRSPATTPTQPVRLFRHIDAPS